VLTAFPGHPNGRLPNKFEILIDMGSSPKSLPNFTEQILCFAYF
jgi:hypothetical protein